MVKRDAADSELSGQAISKQCLLSQPLFCSLSNNVYSLVLFSSSSLNHVVFSCVSTAFCVFSEFMQTDPDGFLLELFVHIELYKHGLPEHRVDSGTPPSPFLIEQKH